MSLELAFQDFTDSLWTTNGESALRTVVSRTAQNLGFTYFAYLGLDNGDPLLISSYPRSWTDHYFAQHFESIDPVVIRARQNHYTFAWSGSAPEHIRTVTTRQFFSDAQDFGICSGITVPIRSGFGRFAALTFATHKSLQEIEAKLHSSHDIFQLIGLYFHSRVEATLREPRAERDCVLSPREIQCLAWASRGKTMAETAIILKLTRRAVSFHLENARFKLRATNITQAVATAVKSNLLP